MALQPVLQIADLVKCAVGIVVNGDRVEVTFPLITDDVTINASNFTADATVAIEGNILPDLLQCMSSDAHVSFVQVEGGSPGDIPDRHDYDPATYPGASAFPSEPSSIAGLLVFYAEPTDLVAGQRMKAGKMFIPGIPAAKVLGDNLILAWGAVLTVLANHLVTGFPTTAGGGNWYRPCSATPQRAPHNINEAVRVGGFNARSVVATQRRRLLPH